MQAAAKKYVGDDERALGFLLNFWFMSHCKQNIHVHAGEFAANLKGAL